MTSASRGPGRWLSSLFLLALLAGCGDDNDFVARQSATATPIPSDTATPTPNVDLSVITSVPVAVGRFVFDVRMAGPRSGVPVILLHGFPETSWEFQYQLRALGAAGYWAVAPNQRGYSPGARPASVEDYQIQLLM